jgi:TolB protein
MHPYQSIPRTPAQAASTLIALDAALGLGDYYDLGALWSDELASTAFYYRLLNAGFRIPAAAGTDNFSDVWRDPPPGSDRTYARVDGPLSLGSWIAAIKAQRTFGSTGPLLFLDVAGHEPGDEIQLGRGAGTSLRVRAEAASITPMSRLDIVVNGKVVGSTTAAKDSSRLTFDRSVAIPAGGWIAARVIGPSSYYGADRYAFAQTCPGYVGRDGKRFTSKDDARFFVETMDALLARVERGPWRTAAEQAAFRAEVEKARAVYTEIAARP